MRWPGIAAIATVALALVSCDGDGGGRDAGRDAAEDTLPARKRAVLAALGENVFLPAYRRFDEAAAALEIAAAAHAADPTPARRVAAQDAWRAAIDAWQATEVFIFGPAGPPPDVACEFAGEQMLRSDIYTFPLTSTCRIDQETVDGDYTSPDVFAGELVNVRGLDAMEYLLFVESADNTCGALSRINSDGSWAALGEVEVRARRAAYAHTLAVLVARAAARLRDAWEPAGGDFVNELRTAGDGSRFFESAQRALVELGVAMLYIDSFTKDMKIGEPSGILMCPAGGCAETFESPWAIRSREHVLANVRSFRRVFLGGDPGIDALGLDDLLVEVGSTALAAELATALDEAVTAIEAIEGTLEEAAIASPAIVRAAYDAIGVAARLFKLDLFTVLDLDGSHCVPGDRD